MRGKTDKKYLVGVLLLLIGGASLADHICHGVDSFPISAVIFGLGIILVVWSYAK